MRRNRLSSGLAGAAALLALAGAVVAGAVQADDDPWIAFDVVAAADGARVATFIPGGPLNDRVFDGGAPKAQARLDGLGSSTGFAAGAYPDELVLNVPGLGSGITKQDLPPYPLIVASSHPARPTAEVDNGVLLMRSTSGPSTSRAEARVGSVGSLVTGSSTAANVARLADGTLSASATSVADGISVGPLTIARMSSSATTTRKPGGQIVRSSSAVVTGASIGGTAVTIDRAGLQAAEPARAALAAAKVTVRYLDKLDVSTGVTSPGLEITAELPLSLTASGTSLVTYTFGRATSLVSANPSAPGAGREIVGPAPEPCCAGTLTPVDPSTELSGSTIGSDSVGGDGLGAFPLARDGSSGDEVPPTAALAASPALQVVPETWPVAAYVVFFGGAGLLALAALALHVLGVGSTWGS